MKSGHNMGQELDVRILSPEALQGLGSPAATLSWSTQPLEFNAGVLWPDGTETSGNLFMTICLC